MKFQILGSIGALAACTAYAADAPTGLNVIPTTDLVPLNCWIGAIQNGNVSFTGTPFYRSPMFAEQSQFGLAPWLEAGLDYAQTPDVGHNQLVFNAKILLHTEDDNTPNLAVGVWNITQAQYPNYYITLSKTLNYDQEQYERYRAHNRRNRKVLGKRIHVGLMVDDRGILEPFAGSDLQISDNAVFQTDWVAGQGNTLSAGVGYVLWDQKTVITPAILFANDGSQFKGISINIGYQFNL